VIDLDDFATVNKALGPAAGNALLVDAAVRLRDGLGRNDTLARIGGDEFVVVAQGAPTEGAVMELANRLLLAGRKPYLIDGEPVGCTMSIGVAMTTNATRRSEELLQEADLALYQAKARGRNRIERFDATLRMPAGGRLVGAGMLRNALEADQLRLDFQPVVDLATGRTVEADAVVQVISPVGETLPPAAFLPIAEEHGLLGALDDWALRAALDQVQRWPPALAATGFSGITVNAPAHRLHDESFTAGLLDELRRRAIPAGSLRLEVNEEVLVESARPTLDALRELRAAGVGIGIDDFGTGSASLAHLRELPIDFIKMDKSLVATLATSNNDHSFVAAIISLAHALGLSVTAAGVETSRQLATLRTMACDRAQGFALGRAGPPALIVQRVQAGGLS
jgi:diguanylate cyclase (GGDEF)-like protein